MWEEVIKVAVSNGIFAVLFCALLAYELKVTGKREEKYQNIILSLATALESLDNVEVELFGIDKRLEDLCRTVERRERRKNEHVAKTETCDMAHAEA